VFHTRVSGQLLVFNIANDYVVQNLIAFTQRPTYCSILSAIFRITWIGRIPRLSSSSGPRKESSGIGGHVLYMPAAFCITSPTRKLWSCGAQFFLHNFANFAGLHSFCATFYAYAQFGLLSYFLWAVWIPTCSN